MIPAPTILIVLFWFFRVFSFPIIFKNESCWKCYYYDYDYVDNNYHDHGDDNECSNCLIVLRDIFWNISERQNKVGKWVMKK